MSENPDNPKNSPSDIAKSPNSSTALPREEIEKNLQQIPDWSVIEVEGIRKLCRDFDFSNLTDALLFMNQIDVMAEAKNHHNTMITEWGKVTVIWWTQDTLGLHQDDFIMAMQTDSLYQKIS